MNSAGGRWGEEGVAGADNPGHMPSDVPPFLLNYVRRKSCIFKTHLAGKCYVLALLVSCIIYRAALAPKNNCPKQLHEVK